MTKRIGIVLSALVFTASLAGAQPSRPVELGVDAAATIGLGDNSVTVVDIPAQALRVGFFMTDRVSLEPKFGLTTISGGGDTFTSYLAELGLLYHFYRTRTRTDLYPSPLAAFYVRPFLGLLGASGGGSSTTNGRLGVGLGMKVPIASRLASRFEANFAHIFGDFSSNQIGLLAGLSFFTR
ncbi:MAG: hypothetical protein M3O61_02985 [Gemmatimonadota bacterium]|nr:hypothetical protein [Gemmatimonadota bacterium]